MDYIDGMFKQPRFNNAYFGLIATGLLLLFIDKLPDKVGSYLIPSLVIYSVGAAFIAYFHRMMAFNFAQPLTIAQKRALFHHQINPTEEINNTELRNDEQTLSWKWKLVIYFVQFFWFVALVVYNCWRGIFY